MASLYMPPPGNDIGNGNGIVNESNNANVIGRQVPEQEGPRAHQACVTCKKQKRKCNKALPACALCSRMNRMCDYTDSAPPPTSEDFHALQTRLMELESKLGNQNGGLGSPNAYAASAAVGLAEQALGTQVEYSPQQEMGWQSVNNRFPAIVFLDSDSFKSGGFTVPKPSVELPAEVIELLGDGLALQDTINLYFATIHQWMPIISHKRMTHNLTGPLWESGPDLALLLLAMKLITSQPQDGIDISQNPIYVSTKRFVASLEAAGTVSLQVLQANLLVTWYEYGQCIYPAAFMTAGWCVRYGNLLGISGKEEALQLLGRAGSWMEQEERRRAWWGVLIVDRLVSVGGQPHIPNSQEPQPEDCLPVSDQSWDEEEMAIASTTFVSTPIDESVSPFPRLCQASIQMGKVLSHHYWHKIPTETEKFEVASQLYADISLLARTVTQESSNLPDFLSLSAPLALTFSTLFSLCKIYSSPEPQNNPDNPPSEEAVNMQTKAVDSLMVVSRSIVEFAEQINLATSTSQDLDRVNPIIMDALYSAASNYAWTVRESGEQSSQMALDSLRHCLRRLGTRWRSAAEYLRILEAQEFSLAVGGARA